jgi:hypothetical protein
MTITTTSFGGLTVSAAGAGPGSHKVAHRIRVSENFSQVGRMRVGLSVGLLGIANRTLYEG